MREEARRDVSFKSFLSSYSRYLPLCTPLHYLNRCSNDRSKTSDLHLCPNDKSTVKCFLLSVRFALFRSTMIDINQ